jgi:hypothetical protein
MINIKSCIIQEDSCGCAIACMATILQKSYKEIKKDFYNNFIIEGLNSDRIVPYLAGYGLDITTHRANFYSDYSIAKKRFVKPFADAHILVIKQYADNDTTHAILMNNKGKLLCPTDGKEFIGTFLEAWELIGIWYPKSWNFKK